MNNYPDYSNQQNYGQQSMSLDSRVSSVMKKVYVKMTLALLVTAVVALFCASSQGMINFLYGNRAVMWVLIIAELGIVFGVSGAINKLSSSVATGLFYLFAIINGMMLSSIFLVYDMSAIYTTFFITAGTFGAMSVYGYFTDRDLSKMGSILFMALIGLIIASLVNMFLKSSPLGWIISIAGVLIFVGLTAWDTQQVKRMAAYAPDNMVSRLATVGALTLYLDFINLFLYLLRFFGGSRD